MAVFVSGQSTVPLAAAASRRSDPERSRGDSRGTSLEHLGKSCGRNGGVDEEISFCLRAEDCRCSLCPRCAGGRGLRRAWECERAIKLNFRGRMMFWTFSADGTAFGERAADFCTHVKQVRAFSETMRLLQDARWIGAWCRVMEFHESGMLHYHAIVDALRGHIPHQVMMDAWNRPRNRPDWAGEPGIFESGKLAGQKRPQVGFVQFQKLERRRCANGQFVSPVVIYVCAYCSRGGKNPHPEWFADYCDGKLDGRYHNAVLFTSSRNFFDGVRAQRVRRDSVTSSRRKYRRRSVRERLRSCRLGSKLLCRVERHRCGEILSSTYKYCGRFEESVDYHSICHAIWASQLELAEALSWRRGFWIEPDQLIWLLSSKDFAKGFRGSKWFLEQCKEVNGYG
jgi:hypothetical protein